MLAEKETKKEKKMMMNCNDDENYNGNLSEKIIRVE